jgi:hypothetical protein
MEYYITNSSSIKKITYDGDYLLQINFRDGSIYRFLRVPDQVHRDFINSASKGGFFNRFIRGKYESMNISPRKAENNSSSTFHCPLRRTEQNLFKKWQRGY